MLLCAEYVLPITDEPIEQGAVLVRGDRIVDVGSADMMSMRYPEEEVHDYGQAALLPGFVDVHTRLESSAMRGIVHDVPYVTWLQAVRKKSALLSGTEWDDSAVLGGLEAIASGITCIADVTPTGAVVDATQQLGLRGVIYREVTAADKNRVDYAVKMAAHDIEAWQAKVDSSRITIGIAPGPLYTCHPSIYRRVTDLAADELPIAMHLAGSRDEYNFIKYGSSPLAVDNMDESPRGFMDIPPWLPTGATPVNYALNWGAFDSRNVLAIHCVQVNEEDIGKLREYDVAIAHCPRCNAQLGMGVAPMTEFLRAGLRVGLGTDSPAAADSTDMIIEMRTGLLVQRAVNVGKFLPTRKMLEMATIGGARALCMDDIIGSLEVGKLADIIAIDISGSHQTPTNDPSSAVVDTTNGNDVVMNMVGGNILFENSQWQVDVEMAKSVAHVIEIRGKLRA